MKCTVAKNVLMVEREPGERKIPRSGWSNTPVDSVFLYRLKRELNKKGFNLIKKRMVSDGHLTNEDRQYLRDRKWTVFVYDPDYMLRDCQEEYNLTGKTKLRIDY